MVTEGGVVTVSAPREVRTASSSAVRGAVVHVITEWSMIRGVVVLDTDDS